MLRGVNGYHDTRVDWRFYPWQRNCRVWKSETGQPSWTQVLLVAHHQGSLTEPSTGPDLSSPEDGLQQRDGATTPITTIVNRS